MMKRQRHYSGWEIAGLMGSTVCLLYILAAPLYILVIYIIDSFIFDILDGLFVGFVGLVVATTLSLTVRQWFRPYPKMAIMAIIVAVLSVAFIIVMSLISMFDIIALNGEGSRFALAEDIAIMLLWTVPFCILPIWMNRLRWRKIIPSQTEAFE